MLQRCFEVGQWIVGGCLIGVFLDLLLVETPLRRRIGSFQRIGPARSADSKTPEQPFHIVFSTGCSPSQDWQSYAFFYHAMQVGQPGEVTRIASGCNTTQQQELARRHQTEIVEKMSDKFHIHFTPDYSGVGSGKHPYKFFNKPFGLRHWMEHALRFPNRFDGADEMIIAVLDPDMILLKPLINDFRTMPMEAWNEGCFERPVRTRVSKGFPIAQEYAFESHWRYQLRDNMKELVGPESPIHSMSESDAKLYYPAGPPYILAASDLYDVVKLWTKLVPDVHKHYPSLLAEMFGYSIASAQLGLKHQLALGLMVSNMNMDREGWQFLEDNAATSPEKSALRRPRSAELPTVLHYCQHNAVDNYFVSKYDIPDHFLSCEAPLLLEPPLDDTTKYDFFRDLRGRKKQFASQKQAARSVFLAATMATSLNQAATFYKNNHCGSQANTNYNKSWNRF